MSFYKNGKIVFSNNKSETKDSAASNSNFGTEAIDFDLFNFKTDGVGLLLFILEKNESIFNSN